MGKPDAHAPMLVTVKLIIILVISSSHLHDLQVRWHVILFFAASSLTVYTQILEFPFLIKIHGILINVGDPLVCQNSRLNFDISIEQ